MFTTYFHGFATGLSLIVAIGAQNAYVLTQGIAGNHHRTVVLICIALDLALIALGVGGMGALLNLHPLLATGLTLAGAGFLSVYGVKAFIAARRGGHLEQGAAEVSGLKAVALETLAISLLNPHVYLDTVVLLGTIAARSCRPWIFGLGAMTASTMWFTSLGLAGRLLAPVFESDRAWRVLDFCVGLTMFSLAGLLLLSLR